MIDLIRSRSREEDEVKVGLENDVVVVIVVEGQNRGAGAARCAVATAIGRDGSPGAEAGSFEPLSTHSATDSLAWLFIIRLLLHEMPADDNDDNDKEDLET